MMNTFNEGRTTEYGGNDQKQQHGKLVLIYPFKRRKNNEGRKNKKMWIRKKKTKGLNQSKEKAKVIKATLMIRKKRDNCVKRKCGHGNKERYEYVQRLQNQNKVKFQVFILITLCICH